MSVMKYKNVLLVAAYGNIGQVILSGLVADSHFSFSVLSRANLSATFPSEVNVIKADYSDKTALVKALTGQDVVISAVGGEGLAMNSDKILIEAALEAGVKWFMPSEYGFDFENSSAASISVNNSLENIALPKQHQSPIALTFISAGAFLDGGLDNGFFRFRYY